MLISRDTDHYGCVCVCVLLITGRIFLSARLTHESFPRNSDRLCRYVCVAMCACKFVCGGVCVSVSVMPCITCCYCHYQ